MASYQPYSEYKSTKVQWLGKIPAHWFALPLRRLIVTVKTGSTPSGVNEDHFDDEGLAWFRPGDFSDFVFLEKAEKQLSINREIEVRVFPENTVMHVGIGATIGKVGVIKQPSSCNQQINAIICNDRLESLYACFYLQSIKNYIVKCGKYTTLPIINQDETKALIFTVPSIDEQKIIADYLCYKTAQIDALIAKKQTLLTKLAEKRTALISHAVTKGLDPSAPTKNSGVEWLGEIPMSWEFLPFRRLMVGGTQNGLYKHTSFFHTTGLPFIQMGEAFAAPVIKQTAKDRVLVTDAELQQWGLKEGDLIFARRSLVFEGSGKCSIVGELQEPHIYESSMIRVRLNKKNVIPMFGFYYFCSTYARAQILSTTKQVTISGIDSQQLKNISVCLPPVNIQKQIIDFIETEELRYLQSCETINKIISKLIEYRSALITNAVTGKIDVRDFQIPLTPQEAAHA